ncbi:MAG TPA: transposase [Solirubrobacterales bacterium]|nr:transposase [Solirubrobacterales bacterium]
MPYGLGAYDLGADRLRLRLRPRRRGQDVLGFMRQIHPCYPPSAKTIYWIQDNLSANWTPDIRASAAENRIELVPTPTYASYLNPIECHFWPIAEFLVNNADHLDREAFAHALGRQVSYRNGPHRDWRLASSRPSFASQPDQGFGCEVWRRATSATQLCSRQGRRGSAG